MSILFVFYFDFLLTIKRPYGNISIREVIFLNERIKQLRKKLDLTQQQFAEKIGVKRNTVATYEMGRSEPSDSGIALICREFNVNEDWLRNGKGEMLKERPPVDEVGEYIGELLDYDIENDEEKNPFYDIIIEMMRAYHDMDEKSKLVIRDYFGKIQEDIKKEKD